MTDSYKILFWALVFFVACKSPGERKNEVAKNSSRAGVPVNIPFDFPDIQPPVFCDQTFNILDFGAIAGDSTRLNTESIRKAIEACHNAGGGKVLVPEGIWYTGPVHLKSNVNLHVDEGAELRFSKKYSDYLPVILNQRGGILCYNYSPFVYARECRNIAITGKGILNGRGEAWWPWKKNQPGMVKLFRMGEEDVPLEKRIFGKVEEGVRPPFLQFLECRDILMEGITFIDGPSWNIHPVFCENMIIRKITIIAHGPNNDGIDPDGCKNVLIEDCEIDVGDDNICLKSGRDQEAWKYGRPCENVVIRRCTSKAGHGGFVVGSEMSAGVRNVLVEDCNFSGTDRGLRFKSRNGRRGVVENIWIRNIVMDHIRIEAITLSMLYDGEPIEKAMNYKESKPDLADAPVFRNIHIENIRCGSAKKAIFIAGLPGDFMREIFFRDVSIASRNGITVSDVNDVHFEGVKVTSAGE